jgi:antitoxin MazE
MITKIQKWGNSLGLRIPSSYARDVQVGPGSPVQLVVKRGKLVISPLSARRYDLARLLRKVNPGNLHRGDDFGRPRGKELL